MEKAKLDQFKLKFERNNEEVKEKQSSFKDLKKNIPVTENRLQEINNEVSRIVEQKTRISSELRANNEKLQEAKNVVNSHTSRNAVVNALMEQKRSGNIEGIFGRLGDLGAIDQKYDVAISTACGSLDNIVTDTMECAQQCVRFLKANNIGSATFIALDKQTRLESQCRSRIETPENVPRLFDLVKINDERVRPAFYFALRDTLVCENLTQATRIGLGGRKRWRVVTLRGELVETSGAMSGGGRPSSGKMGSSISGAGVNEEEIREMEGAVNTLKSKFNDIKTREEHLNAENEKLKRDLEQMKQRLPKLELELSEFDKKQSELKKSINEQEVRTKEAAPDAKKVKELEKKVGALKSDYDKKAEEAKAIEVKIKDLNGKIAEIMDKKVGTAKKQVESLNQDIEKVTSAFTKSTVSQKTALRNIEKSKSKIETMKKELEDSEALIVKLKEEMKEIEIKATDITAKYEECCNERDEVYKKHKELQSELNVLKEKESRLNSDNLDTKHEVDKLEKVLKDKEAEVNKWHSHIKSLQLQEIDGQPPPEDGLPELTKEQLQCLNSHSVQKEIENMDKELKKMKPNMAAIAEYRKKQAVYLDRVKELEAVTEERDMYKSQFENLRAQRLKEFKDGFTLITRKLKEMYRTITLGGDAELEWIDSLDPFSEGINFTVRPNKKSWKRITNLSGGEKTLSSLALIFALHYYKPSPLYVMDEIDAALDFRNVSIVAHYIKQRTQNTQFIIISLRNNMYELANRLVGIYKTSNCTKSVTYNPCNKEARKKVVGSSVSNGTDIESVVEKQNIPITTTVEMVQ
ncbi:structural maintenance of chromosomes protein 4-like protein [Leptotrombidium deliense]|uniref:Structural maintenance of chromosomes protein 4 n=1 Tax=Leptotrombidium deliense TaxID=299467 RepID=A0A443SB20_9ACAR|nr:structural maintenance of chromosomes protein 4-like protein [Leptotrombidium deliense]